VIVEMVVGAGLVAAAAYGLRALRRKTEPLPEDADAPKDAEEDEDAGLPEAEEEPKRRRGGPRGLRTGDVLLYADTELWLAGCIELDEEGLVCRAFPTPGSKRATWVLQMDDEARELILADETDEVPGGRVPAELPVGGLRLSLRRRGDAKVFTDGDNLPTTTDRAAFTILTGTGGRTLVVIDFDKGERLALKGERVGREMVDLLPAGEDD